ncbi:MAG: glutamyl-tRNA reductase [Actinobacteria bacterium]|uniref:glutamyl-tRNA reductase n=1 Tax=freshwater metagenome TaxID=449393 RepID=A0A6J6X116_9ZZZZ|nr:glutamyl-tRNA reductase [Actinomycetota bacterium]MSX32015.1 glutamyl-tRNA reductase [Actinomycetota bacterium]MSX81440.1 glutamyl-tRNA reductase [Actinomycetota bacterium]MSZ28888.1 glutamyl-tRNA reductase [Actinomycetota bacterium]
MSLIVVGLNHNTAPVEMRERVAVPSSRIVKAVHDLASRNHLAEVVLLSTCNRTEIYVRCTKFHNGVSDVQDFLADQASLEPDDFAEHLYTYYDDGAVAHLFRVAAGLDSMIVGEGEILGQVREAWMLSEKEGASGPLLDRVFRHAIEAGKRARSETTISRNTLSVSSAAVSLAEQHLGTLDNRSVLILGAGDVAQGMARALAAAGVSDVAVANRTHARAVELAARVGGRSVTLAEVGDVLANVDLLLTATDSTEVHVERQDIEAVMEVRAGRPLVVVDVAVPRDVDPGVGLITGVALFDMDSLKAFTDASLYERRREVPKVQGILMEELERFQLDRTMRTVVPLITALRERGEEVRNNELARSSSRLAGLSDEERASVEALTKSIVSKLLHEPTTRLKESAGSARGELLADAVAALFDIEEPGDESAT